jgi:hypothetical protein
LLFLAGNLETVFSSMELFRALTASRYLLAILGCDLLPIVPYAQYAAADTK